MPRKFCYNVKILFMPRNILVQADRVFWPGAVKQLMTAVLQRQKENMTQRKKKYDTRKNEIWHKSKKNMTQQKKKHDTIEKIIWHNGKNKIWHYEK